MTEDEYYKERGEGNKREADQFQSSPLMQKQRVVALSAVFSRNSSINKLSQSVPAAFFVCVLCVCTCALFRQDLECVCLCLRALSFDMI